MPGPKKSYKEILESFRGNPNMLPRLQYVAQPDAVASTVAPLTRRIHMQQQAAATQRQMAQRREEIQKQKRAAYRARKQQESPIPVLMSDQQVDAAIAAEERVANGPRFERGRAQPNIDADRLASQYANMQSFYSALGSPNIMPMTSQQVRRNPEIAATQMEFGLNNPALTAIQIAAPTNAGSGVANVVGTTFRSGMRTARPILQRAVTSTGSALVAGGRQVARQAPRVAASTFANSVPLIATAAPVAGDGSGNSGVNPWAVGIGGTALGGAAMWYITRGKGKSKPVSTPTQFTYSPNKKLFAWERPASWERRTWQRLDNTIPTLKEEWNSAVKNGTTQEFKNRYGLKYGDNDFFSDDQVIEYLRNNDVSAFQGASSNKYILTGPTENQIYWGRARNVGRATLFGAPFVYMGYNWFSPGQQPAQQQAPKQSNAIPRSNQQPAEQDTIVSTPWPEQAPTTTSTQAQLDSINKGWRDQINQ